MSCLNCTAETSNGLALCSRCTETLRVSLVNVGSYYGDVERIQPGQRVKVRSAYQSAPPPSTKARHDPISVALTSVGNMLVGWCRVLADDRPTGTIPVSTTSQAGWLESHVGSIVTLGWAHEFMHDAKQAERDLKRILDRSDTGWYAGMCGNELGREEVDGEEMALLCPRHLYGNRSQWVTCPECGRCWDAADRRESMRREARDRTAPVRVIASIVVGLSADEMSVERLTRRIEKWVSRQQLTRAGVKVIDNKPRPVYRIGDVFDLVSGERKPSEPTAC